MVASGFPDEQITRFGNSKSHHWSSPSIVRLGLHKNEGHANCVLSVFSQIWGLGNGLTPSTQCFRPAHCDVTSATLQKAAGVVRKSMDEDLLWHASNACNPRR